MANLFDQETLGSELNTNPNPSSDPNGNEATTLTEINTVPSNLVTITADDSLKSVGLYSIKAAWITAGPGNQKFSIDIDSLTPGKIYKITFDHYSTGTTTTEKRIGFGADGTSTPDIYVDMQSKIVEDGSWNSYIVYIIATNAYASISFWWVNANTGEITNFDNISVKEVTAPNKGIPSTDPWPALAGAEAITAQNDRDFSSGNIGNWTVLKDGAGTLAYDTTDIGGADDKQGLLTSSGDSFLYAVIDSIRLSLTANTLYRVSAKIYVPAANSVKHVQVVPQSNLVGAISSNFSETIPGDTWTEVANYVYLAADIIGDFLIGFAQNPADGDLLYFDDISIRPVQFSWVPFGTNTIEIDETEDALKVTYVDHGNGARLRLNNASDLISDLVVGQRYIITFKAKVGAGDILQALVESTPDATTPNIAETFTEYKLIFLADHATLVPLEFINMGAGEEVWIRDLHITSYVTKNFNNMGMGMRIH